MLRTSSIKYTPFFKGGTFMSDIVAQCFSLLHSFAKKCPNPGSVHCQFVKSFDKDLKRLIYLGYWRMSQK